MDPFFNLFFMKLFDLDLVSKLKQYMRSIIASHTISLFLTKKSKRTYYRLRFANNCSRCTFYYSKNIYYSWYLIGEVESIFEMMWFFVIFHVPVIIIVFFCTQRFNVSLVLQVTWLQMMQQNTYFNSKKVMRADDFATHHSMSAPVINQFVFLPGCHSVFGLPSNCSA